MLTADSFVEYPYVSTRLSREIVEKYEAGRSRRRNIWSIGLKGIGVQRQEVPPSFENRFDMAGRATEITSQLTGSLEMPGKYVHDQLDFEEVTVSVHIGFKRMNQRVAGYFADQEIPNVGRVFVVLFGSTHNFTGWARDEAVVTDRHLNLGIAAGVTVLVAQALEDAPGRVALLGRSLFVLSQDLIDGGQMGPDDGFPPGLGHLIAGRFSLGQDLGQGLMADPVVAQDGAFRRPLHQDLSADLGPFVHVGVHPSPVLLARSGTKP
jgi:hypothetical protein